MRQTGVAAILLIGTALTSPAQACGGFFCSQRPVDQSKERIAFAIDEVTHTVDMHVQIFYQGDSDKFAWVVPVPGVPDVHLSTDLLFSALDGQTRPRFELTQAEVGNCDGRLYSNDTFDTAVVFQSDSAGPGGGDTDSGPGVVVLATGQTGPFDWTVVDATTTAALVAWLADPDGDPATADAYQVPPDLGDKLRPYVTGGANFVAFKMTKDADAGDIAPIRLTFTGDRAQIPLVLTSVAAQPDMRLEIFVFGDHRAVPDNYLHVRINQARINWMGGGNQYDALVTEAANEAGGQAFATDFYGPTSSLRPFLWSAGRFDLPLLRTTTNPADYVGLLIGMGVPSGAVVQNLLREFIPLPQAAIDAFVSDVDFYNCMECYPEYTAMVAFDPVATTAALDERVITPLHDAQLLFDDHPQLTRLTSSMSADEMTLDPDFVLNETLTDPVPRDYSATLFYDCSVESNPFAAPRYLLLADGTRIDVPSVSWFEDGAQSEADYVPTTPMPAASVIEDLSEEGDGDPVVSNEVQINDAIAEHNRLVHELGGSSTPTDDPDIAPVGWRPCGCADTSLSPLPAAALALVALRRRRRAGAP